MPDKGPAVQDTPKAPSGWGDIIKNNVGKMPASPGGDNASTDHPVKGLHVPAISRVQELIGKKDLSASVQDIPDETDFTNQSMVNFQTFLFNTAEEKERLSNAIDFWDSVPRYSVTRRQQNLLRDKKTGTLPKYVLRFCFKGETFKVEISPAKIDVSRGTDEDIPDNEVYDTLDYYPSNREELVEEALRKIACRCSNGFMKIKPVETCGVVFSLYELLEELSNSGHEFSYRQIQHF